MSMPIRFYLGLAFLTLTHQPLECIRFDERVVGAKRDEQTQSLKGLNGTVGVRRHRMKEQGAGDKRPLSIKRRENQIRTIGIPKGYNPIPIQPISDSESRETIHKGIGPGIQIRLIKNASAQTFEKPSVVAFKDIPF